MNGGATPAFGMPGRIQAPNSRRRAIAVIGLGRGGARVAERLRDTAPRSLRVYDSARPGARDALAAIKSQGEGLRSAIAEADLVFVAACSGDDLGMLPVLGRIAHETRTQLMAVYLVTPGAQPGGDDTALAQLRRSAHMLVVSSDETYIESMVAALCGAEEEIPE